MLRILSGLLSNPPELCSLSVTEPFCSFSTSLHHDPPKAPKWPWLSCLKSSAVPQCLEGLPVSPSGPPVASLCSSLNIHPELLGYRVIWHSTSTWNLFRVASDFSSLLEACFPSSPKDRFLHNSQDHPLSPPPRSFPCATSFLPLAGRGPCPLNTLTYHVLTGAGDQVCPPCLHLRQIKVGPIRCFCFFNSSTNY